MTMDTVTAFLPLAKTTKSSTFSILLSKIEALVQDETITPFQRAQFAAQLKTLQAHSTPTFEFLHFAVGLVDPQPGQAYTVLISGLLVRLR